MCVSLDLQMISNEAMLYLFCERNYHQTVVRLFIIAFWGSG